MSVIPVKDTAHCFGCGQENPLGLRVPFQPLGDNGSQGRYTARQEHAGWNGILHGGVTFALMDEALGWSLYFQNIPAVTAKVETRFHKPIPVGSPLLVKAWVTKQQRRLYEVHAEVRNENDNTLMAEAEATMFLIK